MGARDYLPWMGWRGYLPWIGGGVPTLDGGRGYLPWMGRRTYLGWREGYIPWIGGGRDYLLWMGRRGYLPWIGGDYLPWTGGTPGWASTCYGAGGMPLAFAQEDYLVLVMQYNWYLNKFKTLKLPQAKFSRIATPVWKTPTHNLTMPIK